MLRRELFGMLIVTVCSAGEMVQLPRHELTAPIYTRSGLGQSLHFLHVQVFKDEKLVGRTMRF